jgi:hypothetical protein
VKTAILSLLLFIASTSLAGDTGVYPFRMGEWDFELSSVGDGHGGIVSSLSARHRKRNLETAVSLDYRWYVLVGQQFEHAPKQMKPLLETLVDFAAPHWRQDILAAMRETPPTLAYKQNFELITSKPK